MLVSASLHRGHMDTSGIELPSRRTRQRHAPEFREQVVQACRQPGVSIAAVALANDLNANMVRKWVIEAESRAGKALLSKADMPTAFGLQSCRPMVTPPATLDLREHA